MYTYLHTYTDIFVHVYSVVNLHNITTGHPTVHSLKQHSTLVSDSSLDADFTGLLLNVCNILSNSPNQHITCRYVKIIPHY